jgi:hypothetical protein
MIALCFASTPRAGPVRQQGDRAAPRGALQLPQAWSRRPAQNPCRRDQLVAGARGLQSFSGTCGAGSALIEHVPAGQWDAATCALRRISSALAEGRRHRDHRSYAGRGAAGCGSDDPYAPYARPPEQPMCYKSGWLVTRSPTALLTTMRESRGTGWPFWRSIG